MGNKINFAAINAAALAQFKSLVQEWCPGGMFSGSEYSALNPTRADGHKGSFSINTIKGIWQDFATGDNGGDPISLYAYLFHHGNQGDAAKELATRFGIDGNATASPAPKKTPKKPVWTATIPPDNAPPRHVAHLVRGRPDAVWTYFDADSKTLGHIYRFTNSSGGKEVLPLSWAVNDKTGIGEWRWQAFPEPRWLYGLDRLAAKSDATVLVVEGEKCADVGHAHLEQLAVVSWPGGSKAVDKADWSPLAGRKVMIWPDCDAQTDKAGQLLPAGKQPGMMAALTVAQRLDSLGCKVWLLDIPKPGEKVSGWDIADAVQEGLTGSALADWIKDHAVSFKPVVNEPEQKFGRDYLVDLINNTDDFDLLTGLIPAKVKAACLSKPAYQNLLGKIAKKAQVPKWTLEGSTFDAGDAGGDKPSNFERIDNLNQRHAIVPMGGRILVLNRDFDPVLKKNYFSFSSSRDFELRYSNQTVQDQGETKPLGQYWLSHQHRAQYEGILFQPGGESNGYLNLWHGWGLEPKAGSCELFLNFVLDIICNEDKSLFDYVMKWCAHMVQRPQELPETALVLRGKEGIGKNTFVTVLGEIVGSEHYLQLTSMNQVSGRFSGHLANALLVFCNEAVWGGDKSAQGALKSMITDNYQPIEYKGKDLVMTMNFKRMLYGSNEEWVVPRGANDRHYVIMDVSPVMMGDFSYWQSLKQEKENGGCAAFMEHLLSLDLTGWHPRMTPDHLKVRGWELKIRGAGSVVQWWYDILHQGWIVHTLGEISRNDSFEWPYRCPIKIVQDSYIAWATKMKLTRLESSVVVGKQLSAFGIGTCRPRTDNISRQMFYTLPPIDVARDKFSQFFNLPAKVFDTNNEEEIYG